LAAVQTRNQLVAINPKTNQVEDRYDVSGCDHPHGLLIDAVNRVGFVACEDNVGLVVISLKTMQVLSTHSVGTGPDVLALDPGLHRLYVVAESGVISVFADSHPSVKITIHNLANHFIPVLFFFVTLRIEMYSSRF
jgi:DNA-binding beta-propeller fold protein YncE